MNRSAWMLLCVKAGIDELAEFVFIPPAAAVPFLHEDAEDDEDTNVEDVLVVEVTTFAGTSNDFDDDDDDATGEGTIILIISVFDLYCC